MPRDPFTLDQIRMFLAVSDAGSFSAAGRRTGRAQSAVSFVIASLEQALGLTLFERQARGLSPTPAGNALLAQARKLADSATDLRRVAGDLAAGREAEVLVAIDMLMPMSGIAAALRAFQAEFPDVDVRLHVEPLGGVAQLVLEHCCALGVIGSLPDVPPDLVGEPIGSIDIIAVAAPDHPLSSLDAWPSAVLREHLQLIVSDRTSLSEGRQFAVFGERVCRISDLAAKHAMLKEGLGWGAMPAHLVDDDLAEGRLVKLSPDAWGRRPLELPFQLVRHARSAIGPAATSLAALLRDLALAKAPARNADDEEKAA